MDGNRSALKDDVAVTSADPADGVDARSRIHRNIQRAFASNGQRAPRRQHPDSVTIRGDGVCSLQNQRIVCLGLIGKFDCR